MTAIAMLAVVAAPAMLAAAAPIQVSIWTVFLFAGPHNWMEARYFIARMPVRWGRSRAFFMLALAGVVLLGAAWALAPATPTVRALWHSGLILWLLALLHLRHRCSYSAWSIALLLMSAAWLVPSAADVALVYAHPVVALWFLDIQIGRSRPQWRGAYHACLACLPPIVALFWQAGSQALVLTHVFLETLHYGVWVFALPLLGLGAAPWRWRDIPLIRHRNGWPRLTRTILLAGAGGVALLWVCLAVDYPTVRDAYFTVAIVHVLAEAPFLLRLL